MQLQRRITRGTALVNGAPAAPITDGGVLCTPYADAI